MIFFITYESGAYYIRCLDFGIMSSGETIDECKENIKEAIEIYLEDIPEGQSIYDPSPIEYWRMFYELRYQKERENIDNIPQDRELAIKESFIESNGRLSKIVHKIIT